MASHCWFLVSETRTSPLYSVYQCWRCGKRDQSFMQHWGYTSGLRKSQAATFPDSIFRNWRTSQACAQEYALAVSKLSGVHSTLVNTGCYGIPFITKFINASKKYIRDRLKSRNGVAHAEDVEARLVAYNLKPSFQVKKKSSAPLINLRQVLSKQQMDRWYQWRR